MSGHPGGIYNPGNGQGYSVKEVIECARKITGHPIPTKIEARRPGDPPILVASSLKATKELGWCPRFTDLETIIKTAWNWEKKRLNSFF